MKLHYYPDTDSLYIELRAEPGAETREITDGLNVDLNAEGEVVGFDIDHASTHLDLTTLEAVELPLKATKIA
jgi:uncharacterized protein YuzE